MKRQPPTVRSWPPAWRLLARLGWAAGWLLLFCAVGLQGLESSGALTDIVRTQMARKLGPLGNQLRLHEVEISWFEPALILTDLRLVDDREVMAVERLVVGVSPFSGFDVTEIRARRGRLRITPSLVNGLEGLVDRSGGGIDADAAWPRVLLRDIAVEVEHEDHGFVPLGTLGASLLRGGTRDRELNGRIELPFGGALWLAGRPVDGGRYQLSVHGEDLALREADLRIGGPFEAVADMRPEGRASLLTRVEIDIATGEVVRGRARLGLDEGSLTPTANAAPLSGLRLALDARFDSAGGRGPEDLEAWSVDARYEGRYKSRPFHGGVRAGEHAPPEAQVEAWLRAPQTDFDTDLYELFGSPTWLERLHEALSPRGRAATGVALRLPRGLDADADLADEVEVFFELEASGQASVAYAGYVSKRTNERNLGFPMRVSGVSGSVLFARRPGARVENLALLAGLNGKHPGDGRVDADGVIGSAPVGTPPEKPGARWAQIELFIRGKDIALDERVERGLDGLTGVVPRADAWDLVNPEGGEVDLELHLWRDVDMRMVAARVHLALEEAALRWSELPVLAQGLSGEVEIQADGGPRPDARIGVRFDVQGKLKTAQSLRVAGRFQTLPVAVPEGGEPPTGPKMFSTVEGRVEKLSLVGEDVQRGLELSPTLGQAMEAAAPRGFVDIDYRRTQAWPGGTSWAAAELVPNGPVEVQPATFPMVTRDVRGRVHLFETEGPGGERHVEVGIQPLTGRWGRNVPVTCAGNFHTGSGGELVVLGAGIDASDKALLGSLLDALRRDGDRSARLDTGALQLDGRGDVFARIPLVPDGDESGSFGFHLRENALTTRQGFRLEELKGRVEYAGGRLGGGRLSARLADTDVRLLSPSLEKTERGFVLSTGLAAENLPLDREHLGFFLDPESLDALLDDLAWRGRIDIEDGMLRITGGEGQPLRQSFSGALTLSDMFLHLGLPVSIRSARARVADLIFEEGQVRGWGQLDDLYGQIADRNLGPASMQVSYYDAHLDIAGLDGLFEGGSLRSLGRGDGSAFAIDLQEPYPFQLALNLGGDGQGASVRGLLRDLFPSNVANEGSLYSDLRVSGDLGKLTSIRGGGSVRMRKTVLWSVPVVRELLNALGFDAGAAQFDSLFTRFDLEGGVVTMRDMKVESDILHLVGSGTLDFDGTLDHDLEVQYSLVNRLGPFRRLLYGIQNSLLSISIRGDMARPRVLLRTPLSELLGTFSDFRALPLPDISELPERF